MLKRFFIPVLLVLVTIAGAMYWLLGDDHAPRDMREAVPVEKFTLRNGLKIIVMPNSSMPAVTHILLVRAGGADDPYGKTGLAHYLEHLMFMGTKAYPSGVYERTVARVGGQQNAYTSYDFTAYHSTVPKDELKHVMAMEADRLLNITFDKERAARELNVITEERNMRVENSAVNLFGEQMGALTFFNHPYGRPLIGWAEDMKGLTEVDAQKFFRQHYRAGNMVLVVAGDVDAGEVRRMAQHYYGALPASVATTRNWPEEPPVRMRRRGEMEDEKAHEYRLLRQYSAPSALSGKTDEALPLSVLAQYLGGGSTSELYRTLVMEQKLATEVYASYEDLNMGPSVFRIVAVPAPGVSLSQLEKAMDGVIEQALGNLPSEAAVVRAKTQLKAQVVFAQDGLGPLAHLMGQLAMLGKDEQYFYEWADKVEAVRATDMLNAAQHVLDPARAVTGYLVPAHAATADIAADAAAPTATPVAEAVAPEAPQSPTAPSEEIAQ